MWDLNSKGLVILIKADWLFLNIRKSIKIIPKSFWYNRFTVLKKIGNNAELYPYKGIYLISIDTPFLHTVKLLHCNATCCFLWHHAGITVAVVDAGSWRKREEMPLLRIHISQRQERWALTLMTGNDVNGRWALGYLGNHLAGMISDQQLNDLVESP